MRFSAQEEYGLRCLLQIARKGTNETVTIQEISQAEGLTGYHVAKLLRILRQADFIKSVRGKTGGYRLSYPADQIIVSKVLAVLGGRLFDPGFCQRHAGTENACSHMLDCSVRLLWNSVQELVDELLGKITLADILSRKKLPIC